LAFARRLRGAFVIKRLSRDGRGFLVIFPEPGWVDIFILPERGVFPLIVFFARGGKGGGGV
jgi:hypothetical protein